LSLRDKHPEGVPQKGKFNLFRTNVTGLFSIGQPLRGWDVYGHIPWVPFGHPRLLKGNPFGILEIMPVPKENKPDENQIGLIFSTP
jgi:hypothetical protein